MLRSEVGERCVVARQALAQSFEAAVSRAGLRGAAFDLAETAADRARIDVAHQATDVLHLPTPGLVALDALRLEHGFPDRRRAPLISIVFRGARPAPRRAPAARASRAS